MTTLHALRRTPLFDVHQQLGGKIVPFAGWEMPVQYAGINPEHMAVREAVGLFDIGHMGIFTADGDGVEAFLDHMVPNRVIGLPPGKAVYSQLCRPDGGTIDDLIIYHVEPGQYYIVVNASNTAKDWAWFQTHKPATVNMANLADSLTFFALQGPKVAALVPQLTDADVTSLPSFGVMRGSLCGAPAIWARTGYTGEDGYELFVPIAEAARIWAAIMSAGDSFGIQPIGLGARDSLRLEAGLALYGHELEETISPLEANLGWSVKLAKGDFIGREALQSQKDTGVTRLLMGFQVAGRAIPRQGYTLFDGDNAVGDVVSG
ncbi:MAG: glycine cleavage system aminomethyltransferase GcvT, partial [Candidatus Sericytochromatia bacterium]|nr:glycine cleavage system aminomethyltransferase GcvT [Candidatus Sericytochromatia bacterium]